MENGLVKGVRVEARKPVRRGWDSFKERNERISK